MSLSQTTRLLAAASTDRELAIILLHLADGIAYLERRVGNAANHRAIDVFNAACQSSEQQKETA